MAKTENHRQTIYAEDDLSGLPVPLAAEMVDGVPHLLVKDSNGGGSGSTDPLESYGISDQENTTDYNYYGLLNAAGNWVIMRKENATKAYRYVKGTSDYATAWTGRAGQTYQYWSEVF